MAGTFPLAAAFSPSSQPWRAQAPPSSSAGAALSLMPSSAAPPRPLLPAHAPQLPFPRALVAARRTLCSLALCRAPPQTPPRYGAGRHAHAGSLLGHGSRDPLASSAESGQSSLPARPPSASSMPESGILLRLVHRGHGHRACTLGVLTSTAQRAAWLGYLPPRTQAPSHRLPLNHRWIRFLLPLARLPGTSVPSSPWLARVLHCLVVLAQAPMLGSPTAIVLTVPGRVRGRIH
jgi:hypothetical protein